MEEIHRQVLKKLRPFLVREILLDPIWSHLVAREIFSDEMIDHIQATPAKPSQVQRLLSDLARRGPNAYSEFIECLQETEQAHIVDKMRDMEESLRDKEPKDVLAKQSSAVFKPIISTRNIVQQDNCNLFPQATQMTVDQLAGSSNQNCVQRVSVNQLGGFPFSSSQRMPQENSAFSVLSASDTRSGVQTRLNSRDSRAAKQVVTLATAGASTSLHPVMSFSAPHQSLPGETTPEPPVLSKSAVRKNLSQFFDPANESTDNGVATNCPDAGGSVEINAYPRHLGIPAPMGRMDIHISSEGSPVRADWNNMYKMSSNPRGYCLIINNRYFAGHLKERLGTDIDRDNLYYLFSQLGYQICIQENLSGMDMLLVLRDFSQLPEHADVDSCTVVLLTHGLEGQVYGSDSKLVNLSEIFAFFDGNNCPTLRGKPKFFVIQACRGEKYDAGFDSTDGGLTDTAGNCDIVLDMQKQELHDITQLRQKLPTGSDFLIAYATVPGFVSWRNSEMGSWYVQAFCDVFSRKSFHEDAVNMLVEVNHNVATVYESATRHKQMPSPVVLLRKRFFFFPMLSL